MAKILSEEEVSALLKAHIKRDRIKSGACPPADNSQSDKGKICLHDDQVMTDALVSIFSMLSGRDITVDVAPEQEAQGFVSELNDDHDKPMSELFIKILVIFESSDWQFPITFIASRESLSMLVDLTLGGDGCVGDMTFTDGHPK